jgi:alkylation response protein AidB-like acyl-CoA dehydrogenase
MNEILGRARCAPTVFGTQAPDTGNSEILAHFGTSEQKEQFLQPLLRNEIVSCYSMTEPQGGADPKVFQTTAVQDGDEWIINGEKWFSSNARYSTFLIVMVVTDPDNPPYQQQSMFLVPTETPGVEIVRNVGLGYESEADDHGSHAYVRYDNVRVPKENLLGPRGGGFIVAQTRLGGGRIHHAMRTSGRVQRIFDMMCERAKARTTQGEPLAAKQLTQEKIARSWMELEQFKLLTLRTAWLIDQNPKSYKPYLRDIAAVKVAMAEVNESVVARAQRVHGGLGFSWDLPLAYFLEHSQMLYVGDGPIELHMMTVAKESLKHVRGPEDEFELHFTKHNILRRTKAALDRCIPKLKAAGVDPACVTPHREAKL